MQKGIRFYSKFEIDKIFEMDETHYLDAFFQERLQSLLSKLFLHKDVRDWSRSTTIPIKWFN
jgi:hypothetical protein